MSDKSSATAAEQAAGANGTASPGNTPGASASTAAPKRPAAEGNPAFRMMGLPRLRLPSRNWLIFLSITGSFASAVIYDKYQTRRVREKWCNVVAHIADERLDTHQLPRKMTIYLAAPPGDGLRTAREHFHTYMKPVLVAAAMDWDVVEGRKEGDVRHKTAERIRKRRRKAGEGKQDDGEEDALTVEALRQKSGTLEYDGIAGDLVVGRNTWKEYIRGLHEGWLGPVDPPAEPVPEPSVDGLNNAPAPATSETGAVISLDTLTTNTSPETSSETTPESNSSEESTTPAETQTDEKKREDEKPKRRQPLPYIEPSEYSSANISPNIPETIGPSIGLRLPHLLGFRNTPIRMYRFLNRRQLADSIGRDVAAAILASNRPYNTVASESSNEIGAGTSEQLNVLAHEERDWWKTTYNPRKEHEESVWIEDMTIDERLAGRMRRFELTAEDEDRAKRIGEGKEKVLGREEEDS